MNILCLYSTDDYVSQTKPLAAFSAVPFGISSIAMVLRQNGHTITLQVLTSQSKIGHVIKKALQTHTPRLICCTAVTSQYGVIKKAAEWIKKIDPSIHVILGGHHASLNPESVISDTCFNALCVGEGEAAACAYAASIEHGHKPTAIAGLWIRDENNTIQKNPPPEFLQDLDSLPLPDRKLWEPWVADTNRMPSVLLGRGCPFHCTYCSNHILAKLSLGRYVRFRSPENILAEIHEIVAQYPDIKSIFCEAENIGSNMTFAFGLCEKLREFNTSRAGREIEFGVNLALTKNIVHNEQLLDALKAAGVTFINIGLESGSKRIRNEILKRPDYENVDLISFAKKAQTRRIGINLFVMLGLPTETISDYSETIACVRECKPDHVFLSIFFPYPGTRLHQICIESGLIDTNGPDASMERRRSVLQLPGFSRSRIQIEYCLFPWRVYRGRRSMVQIALLVIRSIFGTFSSLNSIYRLVTTSSFFVNIRKRLPYVGK